MEGGGRSIQWGLGEMWGRSRAERSRVHGDRAGGGEDWDLILECGSGGGGAGAGVGGAMVLQAELGRSSGSLVSPVIMKHEVERVDCGGDEGLS